MEAVELLETFAKDLPNKGIWYWDNPMGTKPRILVALTKMLKADMEEVKAKEIVCDLIYAGYVEHERQVKKETGLSVKEFMERKLIPTPPAKQEQDYAAVAKLN